LFHIDYQKVHAVVENQNPLRSNDKPKFSEKGRKDLSALYEEVRITRPLSF
jgi:hypothetical protein